MQVNQFDRRFYNYAHFLFAMKEINQCNLSQNRCFFIEKKEIQIHTNEYEMDLQNDTQMHFVSNNRKIVYK